MPSAYSEKSRDAALREDIGGLMAELASRPQVNKGRRKLNGAERAAVLMLSLGEQFGAKIFGLLDDDELREISIVMSSLGTVDAESVEQLLLEFVGRMSASGALLGNYDATERLLQQYLPPERLHTIMDEIRGPAGRNMWEKLANVQEDVLANYLKNEYPQTVAVVLSQAAPGTRRPRARHPARGSHARRDQPHAAHGVGAEGSDRAGRADAAHRIHVQPVADPAPRRPRGDGGNLQQFRPPDRNPLPYRAGRG